MNTLYMIECKAIYLMYHDALAEHQCAEKCHLADFTALLCKKSKVFNPAIVSLALNQWNRHLTHDHDLSKIKAIIQEIFCCIKTSFNLFWLCIRVSERMSCVESTILFLNFAYIMHIYIKIHAMYVILSFFLPLPVDQFESQVYLWISLKKAEILRPF